MCMLTEHIFCLVSYKIIGSVQCQDLAEQASCLCRAEGSVYRSTSRIWRGKCIVGDASASLELCAADVAIHISLLGHLRAVALPTICVYAEKSL
jgi:hypothetical protein